jgi:DNA modification methylase
MADRYVDYIPIDQVQGANRNPKGHHTAGIRLSINRFGFGELPLLDERTGRLVAGHGRHEQITAMHTAGETPPDGVRLADDGTWLVPVIRGWASRSDDEAEAYLIASNQLTTKGGWETRGLAEMLEDLAEAQLLELTGFTDEDLASMLRDLDDGDGHGDGPESLTDPDAVPELPKAEPVTRLGDLWQLGPHRLLCGDSTNPSEVRRLVNDDNVTLIHADPPYGMGKEADGVLNDNLYRDELDAFQMKWWRAWLPTLTENGSAYIWGNAPDLWRLWWVGGLSKDTDLLVRNEIVWDKGNAIGMTSALEHSYPNATERCLFLMRGQQFHSNENQDSFWEGYEPLRTWLEAERDKMGWTSRDVNGLTGTQMSAHWFSRSQFVLIVREHYQTLQAAAAGRAFTKPYDEVVSEKVRREHTTHVRERRTELEKRRTFFDNTHDTMTDVWPFPRVHGEERYGHATPKPVAMVERAFKSSSRPGDVIGVPFGGSGPDFIAAHRTGRVCVGMELDPGYVDVICRRYQEHTGTIPVLESTGEEHDFTEPANP